MPVHRLYDTWTWTQALPEPFDRAGMVTESATDISIYTTNRTKAKFHPTALRAILAYMDIDTTLPDHDPAAKGAIGTQGDNYLIAEYPSRTGQTHVVVVVKQNGGLKAGRFDSTDTVGIYQLKAGEATGAALFFAIMPLALEDVEFSENYNILAEERAKGYPDDTILSKVGCILCDNLYRRITNPNIVSDSKIAVNLSSNNVPALTPLSLSSGTYNPSTVLFGSFEIMQPGTHSAVQITVAHADFLGKYQYSSRQLAPLEAELVPCLPDWYVIPEDVVIVCQHICKTTATNRPMRNVIMRGPAGSGKTEGAKAIAAGLGLPYVFQTCAADSDSFSFLGQFVPDPGQSHPLDGLELPTLEDIFMDAATAYAKLTGEYDEDVTSSMVYDKLIEVAQQKALAVGGLKPGFQYVDTPLVKALRNGWAVEIQEPSVIANQGVLVGLNGLLDNCKAIMLPTGEILHRHPDAVVIITTNTDYVGCRAMNQSVLSRMDLHCDIETPAIDDLITRVSGITGCTDLSLLRQMAETVDAIQEKCRASAINDGCCGTREFISWVQSYMIGGNVMAAAERTVLGAVSANSENRDEIRSSCFENRF